MGLPARYVPHYTIKDYELWPGEWELWSGIAVAMSPSPKKLHQRLSKRLVALFDKALQRTGCEHCEALQEVDWRVSEDTVYRPDVFIACSDQSDDYLREPPELIAEILSDSTREKDQRFKRKAYEGLGVKYYLMVEPEDCSLELLELVEGEYQGVELRGEHLLRLSESCQIQLDLKEIF